MATPNADRLHGIESWDTTSIEQANSHLHNVRGKLEEVAGINERVASDLGLEGTTADSVQTDLSSVARDLKDHSDGIGKLIEVREEAMKGGIQAKERSAEIQAHLGEVNRMNDGFNSMAKAIPGGGPVSAQVQAQAEHQLEAAHAEFDKRAKKVLSELQSRTEAAISGLPFIHKQTKSYGSAEMGFHEGLKKRTPGIGGSDDGSERVRRGASGDGSSGGYQQTGPSRSATAWHTSGGDASVGSAGSHAGSTGHSSVHPVSPSQRADSWSLQSSHYTPSSSGSLISGGGAHPSGLHSPAVHNPLASAAAIGGGGAAVAGYKAYQAARAARAAQSMPTSRASSMRSGATMRTPTTSSTSIVKGATTAARATTSATSQGRAGSVRGGASGIARPVSASSARGSSIMKGGATTAARSAASTSSGRGSGIMKGATTAARATSSATSQGTAGSARGGATAARGAGSATARGTGASGRGAASMAGRSAGGASSAKGVNGARGGAASSAGRSSSTAGRASSLGRTASSTASTSSRSGSARPGMTRPGASAGSRSASTSRAISGLTGGRGKDRKDKRREDRRSIEETQVTPYETDNTVTFLEAGRREEPQEDQGKHQS